jgi:hypothetical protein
MIHDFVGRSETQRDVDAFLLFAILVELLLLREDLNVFGPANVHK